LTPPLARVCPTRQVTDSIGVLRVSGFLTSLSFPGWSQEKPKPQMPLLNGASCLREHRIGVGADQPDRADDDDKDDRQHDSVLSDVLAFIVQPELA